MVMHASAAEHPAELGRLIDAISRRAFADDAHFRRHGACNSIDQPVGPVDYLFLPADRPAEPADVFRRLRWGGQVVLVGRELERLQALTGQYQQRTGFVIEQGPREIHIGPVGGRLPLLRRRWHYLIARRTALLPPGEVNDRFTFHVELVRTPKVDGYAVLKKVPTYGSVMVRLKQRYPEAAHRELADRSRKLVDKILPLFLSREAAFLDILQRDLPESYRARVPRLIGVERGSDDLVRKLVMTWLRMTPEPLSRIDFAVQAADLLRQLHEGVGLLHLDLRMDNMLITDDGVCLVDFGSAVRRDEDLSQNPLLHTLFDEMMSTSQIQRVLGRMKSSGAVTSEALTMKHQQVDPAADLFYLAVQLARPDDHPDLGPLIAGDPEGPAAARLKAFSQAVLRPEDPAAPTYRTAAQMHAGLLEIARSLDAEAATMSS